MLESLAQSGEIYDTQTEFLLDELGMEEALLPPAPPSIPAALDDASRGGSEVSKLGSSGAVSTESTGTMGNMKRSLAVEQSMRRKLKTELSKLQKERDTFASEVK